MLSRTTFLCKLLGLYLVLTGLAMIVHKQATLAIFSGLLQDPPALYVVGVFTLAAGLAIVLCHNVWSGGALPVVVTLAGWSTLLKGLALIWFPAGDMTSLVVGIHYADHFYWYSALPLALGAYLTYGGFASAEIKQ